MKVTSPKKMTMATMQRAKNKLAIATRYGATRQTMISDYNPPQNEGGSELMDFEEIERAVGASPQN